MVRAGARSTDAIAMLSILRTSLTALALLVPAAARAQVVEVELRGAKTARDQAKYALERDGHRFLIGEPASKVETKHDGRIDLKDAIEFRFFVSDLDQPEDVPYRRKGGERTPRDKSRLASIPVEDIVAVRMISDEITLNNLSEEVHERRARLGELERRRGKCERASDAWFDAHFLWLENVRRLQILLGRYGFEPAARELDSEIVRLTKAGAADARATRGAQALASIQLQPTPPRLEEVAQQISAGKDHFVLHQSQHIRLLHDARIDGPRAIALLTLGEEVIEGFRREFVDPYECKDLIPDRPFSEFWIGPDENAKYERYLVEYYKESWGTEEQKRWRMESTGTYPLRSTPPEYLSYMRDPEQDLEGLFVHRLAEQLACIHFKGDLSLGFNQAFDQDWLAEALGFHLSLEFLGANSTSCTSFTDSTVGKAAEIRPRGYDERPIDYYRYLGQNFARPLDQLVLRSMGELARADSAKALCLVRYLLTDGQRGQDVLHSACRLSRDRATFLEKWRGELQWFYGVDKGDPIAALEKLWRATPPAEK